MGELTAYGRDGRPLLVPSEYGAGREAAEQALTAERGRADAERERAARLAAKLRELGHDADAV